MRSTAYKKQGAPNRQSHIQLKKEHAFYTCSITYKSKWLMIGGPHISYYFQHVLCRVQKARGSIGMCAKFVILVIKFPKYFAAQLVSSSHCIIQTISHQISIASSVYFSYTVVINIQEVRGIYLYLDSSSSSSMQKKKITEPWGCRCHRTWQD
jgi:hypothetical protein